MTAYNAFCDLEGMDHHGLRAMLRHHGVDISKREAARMAAVYSQADPSKLDEVGFYQLAKDLEAGVVRAAAAPNRGRGKDSVAPRFSGRIKDAFHAFDDQLDGLITMAQCRLALNRCGLDVSAPGAARTLAEVGGKHGDRLDLAAFATLVHCLETGAHSNARSQVTPVPLERVVQVPGQVSTAGKGRAMSSDGGAYCGGNVSASGASGASRSSGGGSGGGSRGSRGSSSSSALRDAVARARRDRQIAEGAAAWERSQLDKLRVELAAVDLHEARTATRRVRHGDLVGRREGDMGEQRRRYESLTQEWVGDGAYDAGSAHGSERRSSSHASSQMAVPLSSASPERLSWQRRGPSSAADARAHEMPAAHDVQSLEAALLAKVDGKAGVDLDGARSAVLERLFRSANPAMDPDDRFATEDDFVATVSRLLAGGATAHTSATGGRFHGHTRHRTLAALFDKYAERTEYGGSARLVDIASLYHRIKFAVRCAQGRNIPPPW